MALLQLQKCIMARVRLPDSGTVYTTLTADTCKAPLVNYTLSHRVTSPYHWSNASTTVLIVQSSYRCIIYSKSEKKSLKKNQKKNFVTWNVIKYCNSLAREAVKSSS